MTTKAYLSRIVADWRRTAWLKPATAWGALACLCIGCGGSTSSVSGQVTLDGKPVERGTVAFTPLAGGMRATGNIGSDGSYELSTNRKEGLEAGEYTVSVVSREPGPQTSGPPMPGPYITPQRYATDATSGLKYAVEPGGNTINIELSSNGGGVAGK